MALTGTDLLLVGRGAINYKLTAADLATYVVSSGTMGLGLNVTGGIVKVSIPVASTPPTAGGAAAQAVDGSLYWDDNLTQLFIRYNNGGSPVWVAAAPAAGAAPSAATLAEAAAGTLSTVFSSPQTAVPKDASGMTGAAILPSGTNAQRAAISGPVAGMTRFNTDYTPDSLEVYDGAAWKQVAYVPVSTASDLTYSASQTLAPGVYVCKNLTINAGVVLTATSGPVVFQCYGNVVINGTINLDSAGGYGGPSIGPLGANAVIIGSAGFGFGSTGRTYPYTSQNYGSGGWAANFQTGGTGSVSQSPAGGNGGGGLVVLSQGSITIGASALLSANGADCVIPPFSLSGDVYVQGAGGGSGGLIQLESFGNLTVAGTLSAKGGNGSNGVESGPFVGSGARGGGGGGGGVIYLKSSNGTLTDTSTKVLTGGTGGTTASITGGGGSGQNGGGFGGAGGTGGLNTPAGVGTAAQPGGSGVVIIG